MGDRSLSAARACPVALTLLLAAGALLPEPVLRDALTRAEPSAGDLALSRPWSYVALAPVCQALDALTLLSVPQHLAVIATVLVLLTLRCLARRRRLGTWAASRAAATLGGGVLLLVLIYAATILPRPIAGLHVRDPEVLAVDFHSHTNASRDARQRFTAEDNRAWHRAGGWHVAYVTDHARLDGAARGMAANPVRAGDDTVLLPGIELRANGVMLLVLGVTAADVAALEARRRPEARMATEPQEHAVIVPIPADLSELRRRKRTRAGPIVGLEVSDGGPEGLEQMRREHAALSAAATRLNLAPVAGSNTHGWSRTPPAWSLLRIPGWRELTPEALGARIEALLHERRFAAVRTVERYAAGTGATPLGLAATLPAVVWHVVATLMPAERLVFLVWIWGAALAARRLRASAADEAGRDAQACVRAVAE